MSEASVQTGLSNIQAGDTVVLIRAGEGREFKVERAGDAIGFMSSLFKRDTGRCMMGTHETIGGVLYHPDDVPEGTPVKRLPSPEALAVERAAKAFAADESGVTAFALQEAIAAWHEK